MPSRIIVHASKPRRSRKPLPYKPGPACGPIVRHVRGKRVLQGEAAQSVAAESPPDVFERLETSLRKPTSG